eukprot:COSAG02_NODE_11598_length_1691_cov_2.254397_1_plen_369_part_00
MKRREKVCLHRSSGRLGSGVPAGGALQTGSWSQGATDQRARSKAGSTAYRRRRAPTGNICTGAKRKKMPRGREGLGSFGQSNPKHHDKTVQIPTARIGLLFGKGAATLRDIKERSGCVDIWVDQERAIGLGLEQCDVVLRGEPKATSLAKRLIEEKVQSSTNTTIRIPTARIGAVVGKGGSTLKELKARSGCGIWIESDKAHSEGSEWCDVVLTGTSHTMSLAQRLIDEKVGEFYQHSDSASDAGSSVSSMSMDSTGWFQDKSADPPSQSDFPALLGATAKRASQEKEKTTAGGLWPIAELGRMASAERLRRLESQRLEEEQKKLAVRQRRRGAIRRSLTLVAPVHSFCRRKQVKNNTKPTRSNSAQS